MYRTMKTSEEERLHCGLHAALAEDTDSVSWIAGASISPIDEAHL